VNAQELLITALDQRYAKYLAERKRCQAEFSEEAVHALRVAIRRLLALIELLRDIAPRPRLQKLRLACKAQLDSLDELRDIQVMLAEISGILESLPELAPLQKFLQKRAKRLLKTAEREVRDFKTSAICRRIENVRAGLTEPTRSLELTALLAALDEAYLTVNQRQGRVEAAQPASIHRVRVGFKKFRYMVEIIQPLLPNFPITQLKALHDYQTTMGEIQDLEVFLHTLADFAARHKHYDPLPVRRFYERRHADLIAAYIQNMNAAGTFWRATPEKAFPWEPN
jgi:CHAD domain-containing protein